MGTETITGQKTFVAPVTAFNTLTWYGGGSASIDIGNTALNDVAGSLALNWDSHALIGDWGCNTFYDQSTTTNSVDLLNAVMAYQGVNALSWQYRYLYDSTSILSINWDGRLLTDLSGNNSVKYQNRQLLATGNRTTLDWNNRVLSGTWNVLSGTLTISGQPVATQQGAVMTTGDQTISGVKTFVSSFPSGGNCRISGGWFQIYDSGTSGWATLNVYNGNFFLT
jgi:hypothetical protein